jgi:hypothetical protein
MAQKVFIIFLTVGILGSLVYYMYTISLRFEDSVITQLNKPGVLPPPPTPLPVNPTPTPTPPSPIAPPASSGTLPLPPAPIVPPPPAPAGQAMLSLSPASISAKVGDEFRVDIVVDTAGQNIVAVLANLAFDKSLIEAERIDVSGSVFSLEAERAVYPGSVRVVRGARAPGYNGAGGLIASVYFRALAKGSGAITITLTKPGDGPSRVILDDGQGTDVLKGVLGVRYSIL